jgi:hypothetical protein
MRDGEVSVAGLKSDHNNSAKTITFPEKSTHYVSFMIKLCIMLRLDVIILISYSHIPRSAFSAGSPATDFPVKRSKGLNQS